MKIKLIDGKEINLNNKCNVIDAATSISKSLEKSCIGAIINDDLYVDKFYQLKDNDSVAFITPDNDALFNNAIDNTIKFVILKALIDNYSKLSPVNNIINFEVGSFEGKALFDFETRFKNEDINKIQLIVNKTLSKVSKINYIGVDVKKFEKELIKTYNDKKYLNEIIEYSKENYVSVIELSGSYFVSYYPFLENLANFKVNLLSFSGEYWQNDSNNEMIQRVAFIAQKNAQKLEEKIEKYEELKNNDHRFIGRNLEIFTFDNLIGQGLPIWLNNGYIVKEEIKNFLKNQEWEYDFVPVETPVIGTSELYKVSGHWDHYKDDMFAPMKFSKEELVLRPMTCPHHIQIYKAKPRSYRELPLRLAEHANLYRYESSGSLTGLERVRSMELTDSHIFVRQDQIKKEFMHCYKLIKETLNAFNIKIDYLSLSLRDKNDKEKYYQDDGMWDQAEKELEEVLIENNIEFKKMLGEAAFYGPKLDIQIRTVLGHEITVSTIQLDFLLPQKFNLEFINSSNKPERPIIIHRGLIGTYERFIATLLEQTKGILPLWLAPVQVQIIPVALSDDLITYCEELKTELKKNKIRSNLDLRDERLNYKIRDAQTKKIPYQLVIGKEELEKKLVTYRKYASEESHLLKFEDFIGIIKGIIKDRK